MKKIYEYKKILCLVSGATCIISIGVADPVKLEQSYQFKKCTIDVQNSSSLDISDVYENFPNPFKFFTDPKYSGATFPGPDRQAHCNWTINTPVGDQTRFT